MFAKLEPPSDGRRQNRCSPRSLREIWLCSGKVRRRSCRRSCIRPGREGLRLAAEDARAACPGRVALRTAGGPCAKTLRRYVVEPSEDQTSIFVRTRSMTSSVNSVVPACAAEVVRPDAARRRLQHGLVDRARGALGAGVALRRRRSRAPRRRRGSSPSGWRGPCPAAPARCRAAPRPSRPCVLKSSSKASSTDSAPAIEPNIGMHEIREAVAVAVQRRDHQRRVGGARDQPGVGRVDQHRLVRDVGMARRGGVHLLLEHPLVDRGDRPLRAAVDLARPSAAAVRNAYSATARQVDARDLLGPVGDLVGARPRSPSRHCLAP